MEEMGGMGGMSMGGGPNLFYLQQMFWAVVGSAIACATAVNVINRVVCWQRLRAVRNGQATLIKEQSGLFGIFATVTAIVREISNANCHIPITKSLKIASPTVGRASVVLAELVTVLVLCFYAFDSTDQWQWEDIAYRCGFIAAAQLPLVVLLAGKNNIIGFLIGSGYERLNWLHRWTARILFLTITIHMGFWFRDWARYDYIMTKLKTDKITQRGFAAWCILLWIVLSSFAPLRRWNYEIFVVQHIITFIGFLAATFLHLPSEVKVWIWLPIAFYIFDRAVRAAFVFWTNLSIFHPQTTKGGLLSARATLEPLTNGFTRLVIKNPPISWRPGQHVFLACHGISPFQSHPFTIASLPSDARMEFLIKSKSGCTKQFYRHAEKNHLALPFDNSEKSHGERTTSVIIDGPYGYLRPLQQFESVFFISGSNGIVFTLPLMRSIIQSWKSSLSVSSSSKSALSFLFPYQQPKIAATRCIRFNWVVGSQSHMQWFSQELSQALSDVSDLREQGMDVELEINVYITCASLAVGGDMERKTCSGTEGSSAKRLHNPPQVVDTATSAPSPGPLRKEAQIRDGQQVEEAKKRPASSAGLNSLTTASRLISIPSTPPQHAANPSQCCCREVHRDEDHDQNQIVTTSCTCSSTVPPTTKSTNLQATGDATSATVTDSSSCSSDLPPRLKLKTKTGRPPIKTLIRSTMEDCLGETAVVACGPPGLESETRTTVVNLSDERACCKGTGAHGVWFWGECGSGW